MTIKPLDEVNEVDIDAVVLPEKYSNLLHLLYQQIESLEDEEDYLALTKTAGQIVTIVDGFSTMVRSSLLQLFEQRNTAVIDLEKVKTQIKDWWKASADLPEINHMIDEVQTDARWSFAEEVDRTIADNIASVGDLNWGEYDYARALAEALTVDDMQSEELTKLMAEDDERAEMVLKVLQKFVDGLRELRK